MYGYRVLNYDEIVKEGDEVLNQDGERDWTCSHSYYGKTVADCVGACTKKPRVFRRYAPEVPNISLLGDGEYMMVREYNDEEWKKAKVYATTCGGGCIGRLTENTCCDIEFFPHYRKCEKKIVPLDSVEEIPRWCFGLYVTKDGKQEERLLRADDDKIFLVTELADTEDSVNSDNGRWISLEDASIERLYISGTPHYRRNAFYFYKEIDE